ncbi:hypothetical protein OB2597_09964 [Pseudooceanicola batsensis HTCC2597]|uniref:Uncharacterized protein n=1 Tax=Pseudooceanicola batsensis (strain ATCC BAA-863 / DSM 15984 / KCTC 12145 / HTCC2597) TaxID=252305 RepID=A3TVB5_PSEBH|nr:hypothetical protein [Pseudooceanicola batsensis]EAQ04461.1 hypothetical protein OB2597_09964 [Pseudooceanicola batsensis HTCC2597]
MTFMFDASRTRNESATDADDRKAAAEEKWRSFDFGMDCLIPAEDYALPKDFDRTTRD